MSRPLRAMVAALLTVTALLIVQSGPARATAPAYVALGDSYSSGAGAGDYSNESCLRSKNAYPELWAEANRPWSFLFAACAGARTTEVLNNQIAALSTSTGLVSITIGGNDVGFADVMTACVLISYDTSRGPCADRLEQADSAIENQLPQRLDAVYSAIRGRAPNARVVVRLPPDIQTGPVGLRRNPRQNPQRPQCRVRQAELGHCRACRRARLHLRRCAPDLHRS